ncbi:MAG TPA: gliding motility lipoprotein GldB [Cyclobacteriaceae bacterium]
MKKILAVLAFGIFCLTSCDSNKTYNECVVKPETASIKINLDFVSLADSFVNVTSKQKLVDLLTRHPEIRDNIFRRREYPDDSVFINEIFNRFNNPHIDTLLSETNRVFGDLTELKSQFQEAFTNLKFYYPDFNPPKIKTLISGLDTDLLVTDSIIVVSLDFYLGAGARYRPKMYDYLLKQFEKQNIVPSCLLIYGISDRYNKTDLADKTILADMIAYGKSYYFAKHMLPCLPDSILIGYSADEMKGARENQDLIWARLVEDQVFYSTSHLIKQKYLGERPKTIEVGEKCPGRIAQWVGWQMVSSYAKNHPETGLPAIMEISSADKLFKDSKYKPEKK